MNFGIVVSYSIVLVAFIFIYCSFTIQVSNNVFISHFFGAGMLVLANNLIHMISFANLDKRNMKGFLHIVILVTCVIDFLWIALVNLPFYYWILIEILLSIFIALVIKDINEIFLLRTKDEVHLYFENIVASLNIVWAFLSCFVVVEYFFAESSLFSSFFFSIVHSFILLILISILIHVTSSIQKYFRRVGNDSRLDRVSKARVACKTGDFETLKLLIEEGIDLSAFAGFIQENCLLIACEGGNIQIIEYLLENGSSIDEKDYCKNTCLHKAACGGNIETVKYLLNKGLSLEEENIDNDTCITLASKNGHLQLIQYLVLEKECSLQSTNKDGTCIINAAENRHIDCVVWMLQNGSSLEETYEKEGNNISCKEILQKNEIFDKVQRLLQNNSQ